MAKFDEFPPEIDLAFYRATHADLAQFDDSAANEHYHQHGKREGRQISPAASREGFLETVLSRYQEDLLEIGPFCNPLIRGAHVSYLDVLNATELRARAISIGLDPSGCPESIDYVGSIDLVDRTFAGIVSCHAIEHQPNLVHHLQVVSRILKTGGYYFLIVPDKRYCFDSNIAPSTIAGVLQAHHEKRTRHTLQSLIEHRALTVHNDTIAHWGGESASTESDDQYRRTQAALDEYMAAGDSYIDVHAWYFTPIVFREIINILNNLGLIDFLPVRVYETPRNRTEFCAILGKRMP